MQSTNFLPVETLDKYQKLNWEFRIDEWFNKNDEKQADLTFKSPRMSGFKTIYSDSIGERILLDEEARTVA